MSGAVDLESWLLDAGEAVIRKTADAGPQSLSAVETAVYCMWVLDYAVRNAGSFGPLEQMRPTARAELLAFARARRLSVLADWLAGSGDEARFCADYYERFAGACAELKAAWESS